MTRYTLCEYQGRPKRNSSRHSFAFDIVEIRRITPLFRNEANRQAQPPIAFPAKRLYVPVTRKVMLKIGHKRPQTHAGSGFQRVLHFMKTIPPFKALLAKACGIFGLRVWLDSAIINYSDSLKAALVVVLRLGKSLFSTLETIPPLLLTVPPLSGGRP